MGSSFDGKSLRMEMRICFPISDEMERVVERGANLVGEGCDGTRGGHCV